MFECGIRCCCFLDPGIGGEFTLPLRHAREVSGRGGAGEDPLELGVRGDGGLDEDCAAGGGQADGEKGGEHFALVPGDEGAWLRDGDGVEVDDGED